METVTLISEQDRARLNETFQSFARVHQLPAAAVQAIDLALEEHLTNIFTHGIDPGCRPEVVVRMQQSPDDFIVEISDNGKPFNPLDFPESDVKAPLKDRPVGGLGIHLIRQFVDELAYRRELDRNILTMRKRVVS